MNQWYDISNTQSATLHTVNFQTPFGDNWHEAFHLQFRGSQSTVDILENVLALVRLLNARGIEHVQIATRPLSDLAREARVSEGETNPTQFSIVVPVAAHDTAKTALLLARSHAPEDIERLALGKGIAARKRN